MERFSFNNFLIKSWLCSIVFLFFFAAFVPALSADEIIRNGSFNEGLKHWNIDPDIKQSWNPVMNGSVRLEPPYEGSEGYYGAIIYQNINVTGAGGKNLVLNMDLYKSYEYIEGRVISAELSYITDDGYEDIIIELPSAGEVSFDPDSPTAVSVEINIPADAERLVKFTIFKEGWGEMVADNISLTGSNITVGTIPVITSLSKKAGPYGTVLDIIGENFGAEQGIAGIGEQIDGVTINSWSDTSINITVNDPARSGFVYVLSDYVENDIGYTFQITSPNYTLKPLNDDRIVVKGQSAEYLIRVDFYNGFTTAGGINFSAVESSLPSGAEVTFTPVPLTNQGGVLMMVDTSGIEPGEYSFVFKSEEAGTQPRHEEVYLEVVTIQDIRFFDNSYEKNEITSFPNSTQGEILSGMYIEAVDNLGGKWHLYGRDGYRENSPLSVTSSHPDILKVINTQWGYEYYALKSGNADIIVTASDGTQAGLAVNTNLSDPKITGITVSPGSVSYDYEGDLTFYADSSDRIEYIGYWVSGMTDFISTFLENYTFNNDRTAVSETFQLGKYDSWEDAYVEQEPAIITVGMYASTGNATGFTFLDIAPSPERAQIKGGTRKLDFSFGEFYTMEFYDASGSKVYERELYMSHRINFHLGDIPPGTYRIKLVKEWEEDSDMECWYPNAESFENALPITFTAGKTVENIYFLIKGADPVPEVNYLTFPNGYLLDFQLRDNIYDVYKVTVTGPSGSGVVDFELREDYEEFWEVFPSVSVFITDGFPSEYTGTYTFTCFLNNGAIKTFTADFQPGTLMEEPRGVNLDASTGMLSWNSAAEAEKYYVIIFTGDFPVDHEELYNGYDQYDFIEGTSYNLFEKMNQEQLFDGNYKVMVVGMDESERNESFSDPVEFSPVFREPVPSLGQAITAMKIASGQLMSIEDTAEITDVNEDGRIGHEEVIYILQTNAGIRETLPLDE